MIPEYIFNSFESVSNKNWFQIIQISKIYVYSEFEYANFWVYVANSC